VRVDIRFCGTISDLVLGGVSKTYTAGSLLAVAFADGRIFKFPLATVVAVVETPDGLEAPQEREAVQ
jgi:hypothetical protein